MKRIVHLLAGLGSTSGVANVARRFAKAQRANGDEAELLAPAFCWNPICFNLQFARRAKRAARQADEIWVHCSWTFPVWYGAWLAKRLGKRLVVVPEGSFDPLRLNNRAGWKKRLVGPIDRWVLRQADKVHALCKDEMDWIRDYEPWAKIDLAQVPIFVATSDASASGTLREDEARRVLFLGRVQDPLKGLRFLEAAIREVNAEAGKPAIELRAVSDHTGEQLERDWEWCDVLCLPTLSENFGLVVAEALEHGKRVITTDGAPAWAERKDIVYLRGFRSGTDNERVALLKAALSNVV